MTKSSAAKSDVKDAKAARSAARADTPLQGPVLLFDGVCNLCESAVQFVIKRDPGARFRFASLQSEIAATLLGADAALADTLDSVILLEDGRIYRKSTAALRTARQLNRLWPLMAIFLVVPRPVRDAVYDWIGQNRYRWFGKKEACWVPQSDVRSRFLDQV